MKVLIASLVLFSLVGCVSIPQDKEGRKAYYTRVCEGETANQQGVTLGQTSPEQGNAYVMHECLYKHGIRQ